MSLRDEAKALIASEIGFATADLVEREGEDYAWMRGQQGYIRGLNRAIDLIDEAFRTLGD